MKGLDRRCRKRLFERLDRPPRKSKGYRKHVREKAWRARKYAEKLARRV